MQKYENMMLVGIFFISLLVILLGLGLVALIAMAIL